jgi:hypothetical protein
MMLRKKMFLPNKRRFTVCEFSDGFDVPFPLVIGDAATKFCPSGVLTRQHEQSRSASRVERCFLFVALPADVYRRHLNV